MYKLLTKDGMAKRGEFETVHGTIQTPVFMNVGTVGAIKGAVSTDDLRTIGTQVELSNTYHFNGYIHVKAIPGAPDDMIYALGFLVDRMSVNLEHPTAEGLKLLAPHKSRKNILAPKRLIQEGRNENSREL